MFGVGLHDTQLPVAPQFRHDLHMTHCLLLTTPGVPRERGIQGDASPMKHSCRADLFDDPCYVNTQALQSARGYAGNQSSTQGSTWHLGSKCLPTACTISILVLWQPYTWHLRTAAPNSPGYEGHMSKSSCWQP